MTKIALTAVAILVATGTAFAGSDHYGSKNANQPAIANVDNTFTGSIRKSEPAEHNATSTRVRTQFDASEPGQGIWGH